MKQARIASLYLPFIDLMIENLLRLQPNEPATTKTTANSKNQNDSVARSNTSGIGSSSGVQLTAATSTCVASSASISNGSIFVTNFEPQQANVRANESTSVLGVIAGLGKKTTGHFDEFLEIECSFLFSQSKQASRPAGLDDRTCLRH